MDIFWHYQKKNIVADAVPFQEAPIVARSSILNPLPDDKNFRLVQIETNCKRHFKVHLK